VHYCLLHSNICDAAVQVVMNQCRELRHLDVRFCRWLTNDSIRAVAGDIAVTK
jgi:hypothetical protein